MLRCAPSSGPRSASGTPVTGRCELSVARSTVTPVHEQSSGAGEPAFVVMQFGPGRKNTSCQQITGKSTNPITGNVTLDLVPFEDTVHPVALAFDPPYQELASGEDVRAFRYTWEKLTHAFNLADPAQFPVLAGLTDCERGTLGGYAAVCRKLAGYTAITHDSRIDWHVVKGQAPTVAAHFPDDESQVATAARFRQINKEGELTSFMAASNVIAKAVKTQFPDRMPEVAAWRKARGALLNRTLSTIICDMTMPKENRPENAPMSFDNIHPKSLFNTYFYGDFLHVGDYVDQLVGLQSEEMNAAYHMHAYLISMSALAHLYFGFAVLVDHALGDLEE